MVLVCNLLHGIAQVTSQYDTRPSDLVTRELQAMIRKFSLPHNTQVSGIQRWAPITYWHGLQNDLMKGESSILPTQPQIKARPTGSRLLAFKLLRKYADMPNIGQKTLHKGTGHPSPHFLPPAQSARLPLFSGSQYVVTGHGHL